MDRLLLFVLLGFGPGALIAGIALGVILNYRGSGAINLAIGAVAMFAAFVFYGLRTGGYLFVEAVSFGSPVPAGPAFVVTLAACGLLGAAWDALVLRALRAAAPLAKLVASMGLLLTLQALVLERFGSSGQAAAPLLQSAGSIPVAGQSIPTDRLILAGFVLFAALGLAAWYRWSRFGLSTRAAAENEAAATLAGLSPNRLSMANTVLAFVLAGALGVMVGPLTQLDPVTIAIAVVPALGAALLARFTSFLTAAAAGLLMGSVQSVVLYLQTNSWFPTSGGGIPLPGVADLVYLAVIVAAMVAFGSRLPQRGVLAEARLPPAPSPRRALRPAIVLVCAAAVALLVLPFDFRQAMINTLIGVVLCLSFVVIAGFVGQISLVQVALAGAAGFTLSNLAARAGIGFPLDAAIGVAAATGFGLLTAVSALRVRGVNLAVVTIAAAVALERFGFDNTTWGGGFSGSPVPSPRLFGIDLGPNSAIPIGDGKLPSPVFGWVCLTAAVALGLVVAFVRRSRLGQQMLAVRSNERAAAAAGINVRNVKLIAFALSSVIAGIAGTLYGFDFGSVTATRFGIITALAFVAFAYLGGITTVSGAVLGGLLVTEGLTIHAIQRATGLAMTWELVFAGLALIFTIVTSPQGIAGSLPTHLGGLIGGRGRRRVETAMRLSSAPAQDASPAQMERR